MAIVIPVERLMKGLQILATSDPIWVKLRDTTTCYRDRDTGWTIKGNEVKELPVKKSTGVPSQSLFICVRAKRFVRVCNESEKTNSKTSDLIAHILKESERLEPLKGFLEAQR